MNKSKIKLGIAIASAAMSLTLVACGKTADTKNSSSSTSAKATVSSSAKASSAASSAAASSAEEAARIDKAKANAKAVEDKMTVVIKDKTVDTYDKAAIAEAKASYEALTPEEKSYVPIEVVNNLTKAETDITAKEQAEAQAEAEEAARQQAAAEEAARQARQKAAQEAARQQAQEDSQPSTDQGSGNQSTGNNGGYVVHDGERGYTAEENAQAQAEGYQDAAEKQYMEKNGYSIPTEDDLREWGLLP